MNAFDPQSLARHLRACANRGELVRLPSDGDELTLADAYKIQAAQRSADQNAGNMSCGYKIACTTERGQKNLGLPSPAYAPITQMGDHTAKGSVSGRAPYRLGLEVELGVRFGQDLRPGQDVMAAIDQIMVACEVVEDRYGGLENAGTTCLVADGFAHRCYLLGPQTSHKVLSDIGPNKLRGIITLNGQLISDAVPGPVHSIHALQWLVNELAKNGDRLQAGDIVLTGAIGAPVWPVQGGIIDITIPAVGTLSFNFDL